MTVSTPNSAISAAGLPVSSIPASSSLGVSSDSLVNHLDADATTFNVADLRLAFQVQKWLERNARAGTRYTEFLKSHFGVSPSDARLDRPEYIGGVKQSIVISEVLQTSQTTDESPLAQYAGHGLSADGQYVGHYNVQEYGLIIGLLSIIPKPGYQDGYNRQWLRRLPTDFYFPEFANLSEQAIYMGEICHSFGVFDDLATFGYTGQYDEMRTKQDMVCTEMRRFPASGEELLSYWNLFRKFDSRPEHYPALNNEFIACNPSKRIFAVPDKPGCVVNVLNLIHAVRPLPAIAEPGLIDHH